MYKIYYEVFNFNTGNNDYYVVDAILQLSTNFEDIINFHYEIMKIATNVWIDNKGEHEIIKQGAAPVSDQCATKALYTDNELTLIYLRAKELQLYDTYKHNYSGQ